MDFNGIIENLWIEIFRYFDLHTFCAMKLTCKSFYAIVQEARKYFFDEKYINRCKKIRHHIETAWRLKQDLEIHDETGIIKITYQKSTETRCVFNVQRIELIFDVLYLLSFSELHPVVVLLHRYQYKNIFERYREDYAPDCRYFENKKNPFENNKTSSPPDILLHTISNTNPDITRYVIPPKIIGIIDSKIKDNTIKDMTTMKDINTMKDSTSPKFLIQLHNTINFTLNIFMAHPLTFGLFRKTFREFIGFMLKRAKKYHVCLMLHEDEDEITGDQAKSLTDSLVNYLQRDNTPFILNLEKKDSFRFIDLLELENPKTDYKEKMLFVVPNKQYDTSSFEKLKEEVTKDIKISLNEFCVIYILSKKDHDTPIPHER